MLAGRVSGITGRHAIDPRTNQYAVGNTPDPGGIIANPLYELLVAGGVFAQDSWRVKPNLTVNMGLRWDFVQPNKDQLNKYRSMRPQDVYGPTTEGQLFQPGALGGTFDPVYVTRAAAHEAWNVTPQPQVGLAWTPRNNGSFVERMLGGDKSVLRGGYSFKRFTMPQQFIWDFGSSFGVGFFQPFSAMPVPPPHRGGSSRAAWCSARATGCRNHAPPHPLRRVSPTPRRRTTRSST